MTSFDAIWGSTFARLIPVKNEEIWQEFILEKTDDILFPLIPLAPLAPLLWSHGLHEKKRRRGLEGSPILIDSQHFNALFTKDLGEY